MFYTIYKTINLLDGKIYIGKHQTNDLDDGYLGSGKHFLLAIEKYGRENFVKEILFIFETELEMNEKEAELVTEAFCLREDTYNLCPGGKGGWGYINSSGMDKFRNKTHSFEVRKILSKKAKKTSSCKNFRGKTMSREKRQLNGYKTGKLPKTDEQKAKISLKLKSNSLVQCPHCLTEGAKSVMMRWHFDKCKRGGSSEAEQLASNQ